MKKLYLACSLLFIAFLSHAQITKGTVLLGGDLQVFSNSTQATTNGVESPKSTTNSVTVYPSVGLAIQNNLVLGLNLGLGYSKAILSKDNYYEAGIFLRKYKYLGSRFYFFGDAHLNFNYSDNTAADSVGGPTAQEAKTSIIALGFSPGVAYALSHHWQLEVEFPNFVSAQYAHSRATYTYATGGLPAQGEQQNVSNEFNFSTSLTASFQLLVGLRYLIGG